MSENRKPHFKSWIPTVLKELRTINGLTQEQVAERCGFNSAATISHFESGERVPSIEVLDKLFTALGVTLTLGFTDDDAKLSSEWIYVRKDTLRRIVELVGERDPDTRH